MQRSTLFGFFGVLGGIVAFSAATGVASLVWRPPAREAGSGARRELDRSVREIEFQERQVETAFLGVTTETRNAELVVAQVTQNTAASRIGLQPGDVIVSIDGEAVSDPDTLGEMIRLRQPGERVKLRVKRASETLDLEPELGRQTRTEYVQGGPSTGGTIHGYVTDATTGAPIAGADVQTRTVTRSRRRTVISSRESTRTDASGGYTLKVAKSNDPLELLVMREGYEEWRDTIAVSGDVSRDVELALDPRPLLRGEVRVASTGKLADNVFVRASKRGFLGITAGSRGMNIEKGGLFQFRLEPGHYTITANGAGTSAKLEDVLLSGDGATVTLELGAETGADDEDASSAVASKPARR